MTAIPKPDFRRIDAAAAKLDPPTARRLKWVSAQDLSVEDRSFDDEIIEGVIGRAAMAVLYGDSNSGKTFLAIDMAASIEQGAQWLGRNCADGLVLYLATEAVASVELRVVGYRRRHGVKLSRLVIVQSPICLFDGAADAEAVVALVAELESLHGCKAVLLIGDTLARISAGANENSGEDMGAVFKNADAIIRGTGAAFLWIHHHGKDAARGMRGWSGMRAHIDTEIEVVADDATGLRSAEVTKQRDLPGKGDRYGFRLDVVSMGRNQWGTERTTCVVVPSDAPEKINKGKRQSEVAGAITELLNTKAPAGMKKGDIVKHYAERYERATVYRELKKMLDAGRVHEVCGVYALRQAYTSEA